MSYAAFNKRMASDVGRIHWQPSHYQTIAKHYGVSEEQVAKAVTPWPGVSSFPEAVTKSAPAADVQRSFRWTMNDGELDRAGDIVIARGVDTTHFRSNPIALLGHDPNKPIGVWTGVHADGERLKGTLNLATELPLAEWARKSIAAGVMKAASIGFVPMEFEPIKGGGFRFTKIELMETSLVSLPASRGSLREREVTRRERMAKAKEMVERVRRDDAAWEAKQKREAAAKRAKLERLKIDLLAEAEQRRRDNLTPEQKRCELLDTIRRISGDRAAFLAEQRMLRKEHGL